MLSIRLMHIFQRPGFVMSVIEIGHIGREKSPNQDASSGLTREKDHSCSTDQAHAKCINCKGIISQPHTLLLFSRRLFSA